MAPDYIDGLPPDDMPGTLIGLDRLDRPWLLRWSTNTGFPRSPDRTADMTPCWIALGWGENDIPTVSLVRGENDGLIVKWAPIADSAEDSDHADD